jgi:hypothetical protein
MRKTYITLNLTLLTFIIMSTLFLVSAPAQVKRIYPTDTQQSQPESGESLIFCWHIPHFGDGSGGLDWIAPDYKSVRSEYTVIKAS